MVLADLKEARLGADAESVHQVGLWSFDIHASSAYSARFRVRRYRGAMLPDCRDGHDDGIEGPLDEKDASK